jgi:hypothetical protein
MGITIDHLELHTDARLDERGARALLHDIGRALDMQWRAAQRPDLQLDTLHLDLAASELARPGVAARVASAAMARIGQHGRGD